MALLMGWKVNVNGMRLLGSRGLGVRAVTQSMAEALRFLAPDHFISALIVFGLSSISSNNDCCKTKEMQLIHSLGTINLLCPQNPLLSI